MRKLFERHQRLLAFIGASVVLLTFVLREVVRDHFKDLATSLEQAQDVFAMQRQLESIDKNLIWLMNDQNRQGGLPSLSPKTDRRLKIRRTV